MNLMGWNKCEDEFVRKIEIDLERISSIIETSKSRLEAVRSMKEDSKYYSFLVEGYYEVIKELLVAYMLKRGLRSKNHQCLITYFYIENKDYENEVNIISQMSFFRNRLNYYGESVPENFYVKNKKNFEEIIKILLNLI